MTSVFGRVGRGAVRVAVRRLSASIAVLTVAVVPAFAQEASSGPPPDELGRVVREVERLDDLRSSLARSFLGSGGDVDRETFANVCQPVGKQMKGVAAENGWRMGQMALRYRNPAHRADSAARAVMDEMRRDPELMGTWRRTPGADGAEGVRYFRRITVGRACLACHGAREERPAFVKERYPEDRAYGFEVGDLRGVYSVFVPRDDAGDGNPDD